MTSLTVTPVTYRRVDELARNAARAIAHYSDVFIGVPPAERIVRVYPIPRGGVPAALAVAQHIDMELVDAPEDADAFIDDLIDSGSTMQRYAKEFPATPFFALLDKRGEDIGWVVWPWEHTDESSFEDNIVRLLQFVGEDPQRGGLLETPARVAKAWRHWCGGYNVDPASVLKTFEDGGETYDQMITVKDVPFYSHCEHHMAPIFGTATISYIPNGRIVGLSKLSRITDIFARRLQVQERLTEQIADALYNHLAPKGVGVMIKARHLCMESRGVCQQGHYTITTALRGIIAQDASAKAEFLALGDK